MINKGGVILLGLAGAAAVVLWPKSSHAATLPGGSSSQPSASDRTGAQESQYLQGVIETAIGSGNPAAIHAAANKIRQYPWTHPEVRAAAMQEATNLDDYANSLENYQKSSSSSNGGHVSNYQEANYPDDGGDQESDLLSKLG